MPTEISETAETWISNRVWLWMTHLPSHPFNKHFISVPTIFQSLLTNKSHKLCSSITWSSCIPTHFKVSLVLKLDSTSYTWPTQMSVPLWPKDTLFSKSKIKTFRRQLPVCKAKHNKLISQSGCKKDGEAGGRLPSPASTLMLQPLAHLHQDASIQQERCPLCDLQPLCHHLKHRGKEWTWKAKGEPHAGFLCLLASSILSLITGVGN